MRKPFEPDDETEEIWASLVRKLKRSWSWKGEDVGQDHPVLYAVAGLVGLLDPGERDRAAEAFVVLMTAHAGHYREGGRRRERSRAVRWPEIVEAIPARPEAVRTVAKAVDLYQTRSMLGHWTGFRDAKSVDLASVLGVIVRLGRGYEAYLDEVATMWPDHPNGVFSESVLASVRPRLRGALGDLATRDGGRKDREMEEGVRVVE